MGCVNQNHNKDTMRSSSRVVIKTTLEQFGEVLLEQGGTLQELLDVAYPDANAVLASIRSIELLMQDQPGDLSEKWVTAVRHVMRTRTHTSHSQ